MEVRGQAWVNDAFDNGPFCKAAVNKNINNPSLTLLDIYQILGIENKERTKMQMGRKGVSEATYEGIMRRRTNK